MLNDVLELSSFGSPFLNNDYMIGIKKAMVSIKLYHPQCWTMMVRFQDYANIRRRCSCHGYAALYVTLLVLGLLVFTGRPKCIFKSHLHIPWLTDVQHVQALDCIAVVDQPQWPRVAQSDTSSRSDGHLTIVIVTARPGFKRLPLTLAALVCHLDYRQISEVMLLVPPQDVSLLEPFLTGEAAYHWPWPISIMPDDRVLKHTHTHSYRLQMMLKLVVAQLVKTEYYMILDSDCVALWPIHVEQLLWRRSATPTTSKMNHSSPSFLALYQIEEKSDHAEWWPESEQLLQIEPNTCISDDPSSTTIGVTPAILSKSIAFRTLCRLQMLYGDRSFLNKLANWALWRTPFGRMWTEYTLYYFTARCTGTFDNYHFHRANSSSVPSLNFYGLSVWWQTDWTSSARHQLLQSVDAGLQWRRKEIDNADGAPIIDSSSNTHNLFTVLQSRAAINQILFHKLFYPRFIDHLIQRHNTQKLVNILDEMVTQFTEQ